MAESKEEHKARKKRNQEKWQKLNEQYGAEFGLEASMVGMIRSFKIGKKMTQKEIKSFLEGKFNEEQRLIDLHKTEQNRLIHAINFLLKATPEQFEKVTAKDRPKDLEAV